MKSLKKTDTYTNCSLESVKNINFDKYYGQPIDSLLRNPNLQGAQFKQFVTEPFNCISYYLLFFDCNGKVLNVQISPNLAELKYIKRCIDYPKETWDLDAFKKEKLYKVKTW